MLNRLPTLTSSPDVLEFEAEALDRRMTFAMAAPNSLRSSCPQTLSLGLDASLIVVGLGWAEWAGVSGWPDIGGNVILLQFFGRH